MERPVDDNMEEWEAQLAEYMLGGMEPGAAASFENGLDECAAHVRLARQYTQTVGVMGLAARPSDPPAGHKDRFMARLASTSQEAEAAAITPPPATLAAMPPVPPVTPVTPATPDGPAAPGAQVTDLGEYRQRKQSRVSWPAVAAIAAALVLLVGGTAWLTSIFTQQPQPEVVAFRVEATSEQPNASAYAILNTETNEAYLVTNGLQPLTPDQVYELWWLPPEGQGTPVAAGTFTVDDTGKATHSNVAPQPLSTYDKIAVTQEKAPGGEAPAGPIVLVGDYDIH